MKPVRVRFSVDTKLFRELGELLVGRESTALMELVKNAYDADATRVVIYAEHLENADKGRILIRDDGNGMDADTFARGFLTIAGRAKSEGVRRSPRFDRRYTGAKGVGRLAAHKLAHHLEVDSWYPAKTLPRATELRAVGVVHAAIDWDVIETFETVDSINKGISVSTNPARSRSTGTTISLSRLRKSWSVRARKDFVSHAVSMTPPSDIISVPVEHFAAPPVFPRISVSDSRTGSSFRLELEGEFEAEEQLLRGDATSSSLMIEIRCDAESGKVTYAITPSREFSREKAMPQHRISLPWSQIAELTREKFGSEPKPLSFNARIYERDATKGRWPEHLAGVRVYMEGFRVLPYGERSDDWLLLKADYAGRSTAGLPRLKTLTEQNSAVADLQGGKGEALSLKPDHMYMGAVLLKQEQTPGLQMLINREGFLPGPDLDALSNAVRIGIDLATRARYAAEAALPRARAKKPKSFARIADRADSEELVTVAYLSERLSDAVKAVDRLTKALTRADIDEAQGQATKLVNELRYIEEVSNEALAEQGMLRVLASLGITVAAFAHEVGNLLGTAGAALTKLNALRKQLTGQHLPDLTDAKLLVDTVLRGLERQSTFLVDVTSTVARRRRSRLNLRDRIERAVGLFKGEIEQLDIVVKINVAERASSPPMFPAELTMVFANLITNAIKAAGPGGRILFDSGNSDGKNEIAISNTGVAVDVTDSERWFLPFQSTTSKVSAALGQGMGLGLTITRSILDEYGATIRFVKARRGYATTILITFS